MFIMFWLSFVCKEGLLSMVSDFRIEPACMFILRPYNIALSNHPERMLQCLFKFSILKKAFSRLANPQKEA